MTGAASPERREAQPFGLIAVKVAGAQLSRKTRLKLGRGDSPRSGQPVWRNSYYVGQIEHQIWKPINDGTRRGGQRWTRALLKSAKALEIRTRAERREREPGARNGALGEVGIEVLEYLYGVVDYANGKLEPAIRTIAAEIGRSYSAVHEALNRLRLAGFLNWMRRSRPIEDPEPDGPQVEQASNAYALLVPTGMKSWLLRLVGKGPPPACDQDRRQQDRADFEAMLASVSAVEAHEATWNGDRLLGETLKRLARAVDARDRQTANPPEAMKPGDCSSP